MSVLPFALRTSRFASFLLASLCLAGCGDGGSEIVSEDGGTPIAYEYSEDELVTMLESVAESGQNDSRLAGLLPAIEKLENAEVREELKSEYAKLERAKPGRQAASIAKSMVETLKSTD